MPKDKRFNLTAERFSIKKSRLAAPGGTPAPDVNVTKGTPVDANAEQITSFQSDTTSEDSINYSEEELEVSAYHQKREEEVPITLPPNILVKTSRTADNMGLRYHQRVALINSVVANSGGDINKITLSHESSHRISDKIICNDAAILKANVSVKVMITGKPIIVHFNGNIIKDFTGKVDSSINQMCVLINHEGETHLL